MSGRVDICYIAKNRLEFTRETLRVLRKNTNWSLVNALRMFDDGSIDGTDQALFGMVIVRALDGGIGTRLECTDLGSAVLVFNHFIRAGGDSEYVVKIDNDAVVPPGWLDIVVDVMDRHPELQVLSFEGWGVEGTLPYNYKPCGETTDGLFIARRSCFAGMELPALIEGNKYEGWSQWLAAHKICRGWLAPSFGCFLLDRIPFEPWRSLSLSYIQKGWQRPWYVYNEREHAYLYQWWRDQGNVPVPANLDRSSAGV